VNDYASWHNTTLDVGSSGPNQLNIEVFNNANPVPGPNPTALRVDFALVQVPEPTTMGLMAAGIAGLAFLRRQTK